MQWHRWIPNKLNPESKYYCVSIYMNFWRSKIVRTENRSVTSCLDVGMRNWLKRGCFREFGGMGDGIFYILFVVVIQLHTIILIQRSRHLKSELHCMKKNWWKKYYIGTSGAIDNTVSSVHSHHNFYPIWSKATPA